MLITSLPPSMDDELFQTAPQQQQVHNQNMFYDYYSVSPPPPLMMISNVFYLINYYPLYQTVTASPGLSLYYPTFYPLSYVDDVNKVSKLDEKSISSVASKDTPLRLNFDNGVKSTPVKVSKPDEKPISSVACKGTPLGLNFDNGVKSTPVKVLKPDEKLISSSKDTPLRLNFDNGVKSMPVKVSKPDEKLISSVGSKGTPLGLNLDNGVKLTLVKVSKPYEKSISSVASKGTPPMLNLDNGVKSTPVNVSKPDEKFISSVASKDAPLWLNLDNDVKSTSVKVSKPITIVKPKASRRTFKGNPMEAISRGPRLMMYNRPCIKERWAKKDNYKTTLMIRNIPNHFKRDYLLDMLDKHCFDENKKADSISDPVPSAYDFVYLPMDFGYHLNLGYGFVNFTNPVGALRFRKVYHGFEWESDNRKICKICWGRSQGKEECIKEVVNKTLKCTSDEYLPVVFSPPRDGRTFSEAEIVGTRIVPLPHETCGTMLKCRRSKK